MGRQGMDTLIRELAEIGEQFIPEIPEMFFRLYFSTDGIKGKSGHLLTLWSDGPIVYEGLESISIFTLKHYVELLPVRVAVISLFSVDVKGFQDINSPSVEHFPVLRLIGGVEIECGSFPVVMRVRGHDATMGNAGDMRRN